MLLLLLCADCDTDCVFAFVVAGVAIAVVVAAVAVAVLVAIVAVVVAPATVAVAAVAALFQAASQEVSIIRSHSLCCRRWAFAR